MSKEIEVVWWNGQRGSFCQAIVEFLTEGMTHRMDIKELQGDGAIVVVKADQTNQFEFLASSGLHYMKWKLFIVVANEEGTWRCTKSDFENPGWKLWLQTPHRNQYCDVALPWGWTPGCATEQHLPKLWDWSFAGQITHSRREEFLKVARTMDDKQRMLVTSKGFSQGIPQDMYYKMLAGTKVAPCPSGPITVDSMRVCEALQAGCVPLVDTISPTGPYPEYWSRVFGGDHLLFRISNWNELPHYLKVFEEEWPMWAERTSKWWSDWKKQLRYALHADVSELSLK